MVYNREIHCLDNGLRIVLEQRPGAIAAGVCCAVGAGSRNDYPRKEGIAHYVEHLLFRSRLKGETAGLFDRFANGGGDMNAVTMLDRTSFSVQCLSEDVQLGICVLARIISHLPATEDDLKSERNIILDEVLLTGEDSGQAFQRVKFKLLGGDESLRHAATGRSRRLGRISPEDVRRFYSEFYRAGNMVVSVVGDFDPEPVLDGLRAEFGVLPAGETAVSQPVPEARGPKIRMRRGAVPEGYVSCFFRSPSLRSEKLPALQLVADVLVGGPHSRLFRRLRERESLVYDVTGNLELTPEFGTLDIMVPTKKRNLFRVLKAVLEEVDSLRSESLSEEELALWRTSLIKRGLLGFDDVTGAAAWYAEAELLASGRNSDDFSGWIEKLNRVGKAEFDSVASEIFSPENSFVYLVGALWPWQEQAAMRLIRNIG